MFLSVVSIFSLKRRLAGQGSKGKTYVSVFPPTLPMALSFCNNGRSVFLVEWYGMKKICMHDLINNVLFSVK